MMSANAGAAPHAAPARDDNAACRAARRYAMISVYYRSLGSQLESRGAPVIAVPPDVRPLSLVEALRRLDDDPQQLWDAYWCIVRAVPVDGSGTGGPARRYPPELIERLRGIGEVERLDGLRRESRGNAHLLAAALVACADKRWAGGEVDTLADLVEANTTPEMAEATEAVLGWSGPEFVRQIASEEPHLRYENDTRAQRADELVKLQEQVGLNLNDFVQDLLDTIAFARFMNEWHAPDEPPRTPLTSSCVVRQDTNTLTTTATVTSLVQTPFPVLAAMLDPLGWWRNSDVIQCTYYVEDPHTLRKKDYGEELGTSFDERRFLFEDVAVRWGDDDVQTGEFRNVLLIDYFHVDTDRRTLTLPFRLCRSIDSSILWDDRAGGILVDDGYIVVRPAGPVGSDLYRLTARKVLRFSDRTPYSSAPGLLDIGQMLNYLSPAAVTWWLETDMYSSKRVHAAGDDAYAPAGYGDKAEGS